MAYIKVTDGTEIFYYDWGKGAPVVLIHGWPLTSASWEYQAYELAEQGYRVIAYDRRGFGKSGWANSGYDYDTLSNDLNCLIKELDLNNVALVGFSMGGGEVARYLNTYGSDRVSKAVFIASVTPFLLKTENNPDGIDKQVFDDIIEGIKKDRPAFFKEFSQKFYGRTLMKHTVSEPFIEFFQSMALSGSPKATIELVRAWSETDFRDDLMQIIIPTLFIHGTADLTVPIELSERKASDLLPHATVIEYEGEPHGLTATAHERLNTDLLAFLNKQPIV
jgi:pimeloyl-ACP methyl ester carboxylesterase